MLTTSEETAGNKQKRCHFNTLLGCVFIINFSPCQEEEKVEKKVGHFFSLSISLKGNAHLVHLVVKENLEEWWWKDIKSRFTKWVFKRKFLRWVLWWKKIVRMTTNWLLRCFRIKTLIFLSHTIILQKGPQLQKCHSECKIKPTKYHRPQV